MALARAMATLGERREALRDRPVSLSLHCSLRAASLRCVLLAMALARARHPFLLKYILRRALGANIRNGFDLTALRGSALFFWLRVASLLLLRLLRAFWRG